MTKPVRSEATPHPGAVLYDWILEHGHTQRWLAEQLGVSMKHINHIVRGRSLYSERVAIKLGAITGKSARYWVILRSDYRLAQAERRDDDERTTQSSIRNRNGRRQPTA